MATCQSRCHKLARLSRSSTALRTVAIMNKLAQYEFAHRFHARFSFSIASTRHGYAFSCSAQRTSPRLISNELSPYQPIARCPSESPCLSVCSASVGTSLDSRERGIPWLTAGMLTTGPCQFDKTMCFAIRCEPTATDDYGTVGRSMLDGKNVR